MFSGWNQVSVRWQKTMRLAAKTIEIKTGSIQTTVLKPLDIRHLDIRYLAQEPGRTTTAYSQSGEPLEPIYMWESVFFRLSVLEQILKELLKF